MSTRNHITDILIGFTFWSILSASAMAQVSADGTTATDVDTSDNQNFDINGGDRAGNNLFHSFGDFSVPGGGSANFLNSSDIENIISRVTGGKISTIEGLIRANGSANLFLINPAGIIFGAGARLDIGGSFLGSSADSLSFVDGNQFSAVNAQGKPLLTINAPIGLNLRDNPNPIENNSVSGLQVKGGENFTLVGGDINFNGGKITAPGGTVSLGSLGAAGTVGLSDNGNLIFPDGITRGDISLTNDASVDVVEGGGGSIFAFAKNLNMSGGSELLAGIGENQSSPNAVAGDININAIEAVTLTGSPTAFTQKDDNTQTEEQKKPINEGLTTEKDRSTAIRNNVGLAFSKREDGSDRSKAKGTGGNININTDTLKITNVAGIDGSLYGEGKGSNINLSAKEISLDGLRSYISSQLQGADFVNIKEKARGTAGDINIDTNNLTLNKFSGISTRILDDAEEGQAGNIKINAADRVTLDNGSFFLSQVGKRAKGTGGNISIDTNNLSLTGNPTQFDKSSINADLLGLGNAGNITIKAKDTVLVENQGLLLTQVGATGVGNAGNIDITTNNFSLKNQARILTDTQGKGNAGNININAQNKISLEGNSYIISSVDLAKDEQQKPFIDSQGKVAVGEGEGGDINLTTNNLTLADFSFLIADTKGKGNAGDINIDAKDNVSVNKSFVISSVEVPKEQLEGGTQKPVLDSDGKIAVGEGNAGNINITTNNLNLIGQTTDNAYLIADTKGKGNAGDININAKDNMFVDRGLILSSVEIGKDDKQKPFTDSDGKLVIGEGNAGNINITTGNLTITGNSFKDGDRSFLIADTKGIGNAGDIKIDATGKISLDKYSLIIASVDEPKLEKEVQTPGGVGNAGNIAITTVDLNLNNQSLIIADTKNKGDAGNININARGNISLDVGSKIVAGTGSRGIEGQVEGNAGRIDITANSLSLNDFSVVTASTNRKAIRGTASDINITTNNDLRLTNGSVISALTENAFYSQNQSNAGNININAQNLELRSGGKIFTGTDGNGSAGNIELKIAKDITIDGSNTPTTPISPNLKVTDSEPLFTEQILKDLISSTGLFANGTEKATGNSGNISISANNLNLNNQAKISAETFRGGGNINLTITNAIKFRNNSEISAAASDGATGGNINIQADSVVASANGNNNIKASAEFGKGGKIEIAKKAIAWGWTTGKDSTQTNDLDATSNVEGLSGTVSISTQDFQSNQEVVESPQNVVEIEQVEAQACSANQNIARESSFTIIGRGNVQNGTQPFNANTIKVSQAQEKRSLDRSNTQDSNVGVFHETSLQNDNVQQKKPISSDEIIPARGIAVNAQGQIVLTRYPTNNAGERIPEQARSCQ
jgi:filamentous hemagglutinin family protein